MTATIKVIARHIRDDIDHILNIEEILDLEQELGTELLVLYRNGLRNFEMVDEWTYRLMPSD